MAFSEPWSKEGWGFLAPGKMSEGRFCLSFPPLLSVFRIERRMGLTRFLGSGRKNENEQDYIFCSLIIYLPNASPGFLLCSEQKRLKVVLNPPSVCPKKKRRRNPEMMMHFAPTLAPKVRKNSTMLTYPSPRPLPLVHFITTICSTSKHLTQHR